MPEAVHALAQTAIFLSLPPKSNAAYKAIARPRAHVRADGEFPPPYYRTSNAEGYDYPHDRPGHLSDQELLPDGLEGETFYRPDDAEAGLRDRLEEVRRSRGRND